MVIFTSISQIDGKINYWNGKDSLKLKEYLEDNVKQKPGPQRKMRLVDEYLMVFMRLRLGLMEQGLAQRLCVSVSAVSRVLITWYNLLAEYLKHLIVWPSKDIIAANMSQCFKKFPNVEQTRRIAAVKIHVEHKMEQIKNFRILQGVIPATEWHNANNIVLICAALSNFEPPLAT